MISFLILPELLFISSVGTMVLIHLPAFYPSQNAEEASHSQKDMITGGSEQAKRHLDFSELDPEFAAAFMESRNLLATSDCGVARICRDGHCSVFRHCTQGYKCVKECTEGPFGGFCFFHCVDHD